MHRRKSLWHWVRQTVLRYNIQIIVLKIFIYWISTKLKILFLWKTSKKTKDKQQTGRKYLQFTYWQRTCKQNITRALYTQCTWVLRCVWLCDLMSCSLSGSSVHSIFQARILEWVAMSSSRGSFQPRDRTHTFLSLALSGGFFTTVPPGK